MTEYAPTITTGDGTDSRPASSEADAPTSAQAGGRSRRLFFGEDAAAQRRMRGF